MENIKVNPVSEKFSLKEMIDDLRHSYNEWLEEVNWVLTDQEKLIDNWEINIAVDFYHVYEFAYPFNSFLKENDQVELPPVDVSSKLIQHWAALSYLFYGLRAIKKPILLVPHIEELKEFIKDNVNDYLTIPTQFEKLKNWRAEILTDDDEKLILEAAELYNENNRTIELPNLIRNALVELIFKKFYNLFLLISGFSLQGINRIKKLIEEERVIIDSDLAIDYADEIHDVLKDKEQRFFDVFKKMRKMAQKRKQNFRDAKLLEIVVAINKKFKIENSKKILYLLSDAISYKQLFQPHRYPLKENTLKEYEIRLQEKDIDVKEKQNIQAAINRIHIERKRFRAELEKVKPDLSILGSENSLHRTTNIFLVYMMAADVNVDQSEDNFADSRNNTLNRLKAKKENLLQFIILDKSLSELIKDCKKNCDTCINEQKRKCDLIKLEIENWQKTFNARISMDILAYHSSSIKPFLKKASDDMDNGMRAIVEFLSGKNDEFEKEVYAKKNELDIAYKDAIDELRKHMVDFSVNFHEELVFRLKPLKRIPFLIAFENMKIKSKLEEAEEFVTKIQRSKIDESHKDEIENRFREISNDILELTKDESIDPERHLLFAILHYNFKGFEHACSILSDCLKRDNLPNREVYILLKILALHQFAISTHNKVFYEEAKTLCYKELKHYPKDSRFFYMYGVLVGRGIQTRIDKDEDLCTPMNYFDQALEHIEQNINNKLFEATIWNNIAFALYLKQNLTEDDLDKAFLAIDKMADLVPEDEWDANFLDTKGLVLFLKFQKLKDSDSKKDIIIQSKECLTKAKDLAIKNKALGYERKAIEDHLEMISKQEN